MSYYTIKQIILFKLEMKGGARLEGGKPKKKQVEIN